MNDFNFFSSYKPQKIKKTKSVQVVNIIFALVAICVAGVIAMNYYIMLNNEKELKSVAEQLMVIKASEDYVRVLNKKQLLSELDQVVLAVAEAGDEIEISSLISENLLAVISDTMPSDVSLDTISVNSEGMQLSGTALTKPAIAEYEYRLKQIDFIESIFLTGIESGTDEVYSFAFTVQIGGGAYEN